MCLIFCHVFRYFAVIRFLCIFAMRFRRLQVTFNLFAAFGECIEDGQSLKRTKTYMKIN